MRQKRGSGSGGAERGRLRKGGDCRRKNGGRSFGLVFNEQDYGKEGERFASCGADLQGMEGAVAAHQQGSMRKNWGGSVPRR